MFFGRFTFKPQKGNYPMFGIEEIRENKRARRPISSLAAHSAAVALVLVMALGSSTAAAAGSNGNPPTPQNFRVTAGTAYTVTLAWNSGNGNSGDFNYYLSGAYNVGPTVILPKTATSYTFTALIPGNTYWFSIYTRNAAGKTSGQANVSTTTLHDTTPPSTAPVLSLTEIGSNYASLSWTPAQDDGPYLFYEVWVNGVYYAGTARNVTSVILQSLEPQTTYAVTVRAYDYGNNRGPFSSPLSITTLPPNPNDHTPPTTPGNLTAETFGDGSTEIHLRWTQSSDDFDAQANIRYEVYVNGVLADVLFGSGGPSIVYSDFGNNLIEVFATDTAGNRSAPATITVFF
jgi:Fibronectin type III domain